MFSCFYNKDKLSVSDIVFKEEVLGTERKTRRMSEVKLS